MKSNREIRGYKVKSLPPQRESAWSRRHHLLQSHSELLDTRGTLALTGMRCLRWRWEWAGVTWGDLEEQGCVLSLRTSLMLPTAAPQVHTQTLQSFEVSFASLLFPVTQDFDFVNNKKAR